MKFDRLLLLVALSALIAALPGDAWAPPRRGGVTCGGPGKRCCPRGRCRPALRCLRGRCMRSAIRCGSLGSRCCSGSRCLTGLKCQRGRCRKLCGALRQRCCLGRYCRSGLRCGRGRCYKKPNPATRQKFLARMAEIEVMMGLMKCPVGARKTSCASRFVRVRLRLSRYRAAFERAYRNAGMPGNGPRLQAFKAAAMSLKAAMTSLAACASGCCKIPKLAPVCPQFCMAPKPWTKCQLIVVTRPYKGKSCYKASIACINAMGTGGIGIVAPMLWVSADASGQSGSATFELMEVQPTQGGPTGF